MLHFSRGYKTLIEKEKHSRYRQNRSIHKWYDRLKAPLWKNIQNSKDEKTKFEKYELGNYKNEKEEVVTLLTKDGKMKRERRRIDYSGE